MRSLLLRLHREEGVTALMVTHDANEALMMSDTIVALDGGRVTQVGAPEVLYRDPATAKIAACFGDCSVLEGAVRAERFSVGEIALPAVGVPDGPAVAVVRQGACSLGRDGEEAGKPCAGEAVVRCGVYAGAAYLARLDVAGQTLTVPTAALPGPGEAVPVFIGAEGCFVFSRPS